MMAVGARVCVCVVVLQDTQMNCVQNNLIRCCCCCCENMNCKRFKADVFWYHLIPQVQADSQCSLVLRPPPSFCHLQYTCTWE